MKKRNRLADQFNKELMTVFQSKNTVPRMGKQEQFTRETILLRQARTEEKQGSPRVATCK